MSSPQREGTCGHCMTLVDQKKYRCEHCAVPLCPTHRGKAKGLFSTSYYCLPPCPHLPAEHREDAGVVRDDSPTKRGADDDGRSDAGVSPPPPRYALPVGRPPSATALKGKMSVLQTSFGVIQEESESTPQRLVSSSGRSNDDGSTSARRYAHTDSLVSRAYRDDGGDLPVPHGLCEGVREARDACRSTVSPVPSSSGSGGGSQKVYNHRGELQEIISPTDAGTGSMATSTMSFSRSRRSLVASATLDESAAEQAPVRPPPSLATSTASSASQQHTQHVGKPGGRVRGVGLPLIAPEPLNPETGKRRVCIGPDMYVDAVPEERTRFVEVELAQAGSTHSNSVLVVRGTILGNDGDYMVWHERGKRYAQRLTPSDVRSIVVITPARCKHCGSILPRDEADEHVASHRRGGGIDLGTAVGDEHLGTACGDTALLLRLVRVRQLGAGAQGEVWLCRDGDGPAAGGGGGKPKAYVQKDMRCETEKEAIAKYQQSVRLMNLNHVHIITYLAVQRHLREPVVTVLMPYFSEGDVAGLVRAQRQPLSEHYVSSLLLQMAAALHFLHTRTPSIIHGDIKPENILLFNRREQIMLMDLDASRELTGHAREATVHVGTSAWMAPEAFHLQQSTTKSDIWSLGLVAYVLLVLPDFPMLHCEATNGNEMLNSKAWTMDELLRRVGGRIVGRGFSKQLALLVTRMLHHDPRRRPHAADLSETLTDLMTAQLVLGNGPTVAASVSESEGDRGGEAKPVR